MKLKSVLVSVLLAILIGGSVALCAMWGLARVHRKRFEELAVDGASLRVGESTFSDLERLRSRYSKHVAVESDTCTPSSCKLRIILANFLVTSTSPYIRWINIPALLRIGIRPAVAVLSVSVTDEKVRNVNFIFTYEAPNYRWPKAHWQAVDQLSVAEYCKNQVLHLHPAYSIGEGFSGSGIPFGPVVGEDFTSQATSDERERCQRIRIECATSLSDCAGNPAESATGLMPELRKQIQDEEAAEHSDSEYRREEQRCFSRQLFLLHATRHAESRK